MPSYKPCRKFLVYDPEGYARGGLLGTDWYMQKKKEEIEIEIIAYAKVYL